MMKRKLPKLSEEANVFYVIMQHIEEDQKNNENFTFF